MNYRHLYHAGNFADVVKHVTLISLLKKLCEKDKPFAVLDAFAGLGLYDLASEEALRTKESESGVGALVSHGLDPRASEVSRDPRVKPVENSRAHGMQMPPIITEYLRVTASHNGLYPGSPMIAASYLREEDQLIAAELHPADYATLKHNMRRHNNVHVHHIDAYNAIKAFCPPKEKRGLVLLDPAFEVKDEFTKVLDALRLIKKRFSAGVVMVWYPIKDKQLVEKFYKDYREVGYAETLTIEFEVNALEGMKKCGILIANPPYIEPELREAMDYLALVMGGGYCFPRA